MTASREKRDAVRARLAGKPSTLWVDLHDAAPYLGLTISGLRSAVLRKAIEVDGRGARGIALFRLGSLDAFLERQALAHEETQAREREAATAAARKHAPHRAPAPARGPVPITPEALRRAREQVRAVLARADARRSLVRSEDGGGTRRTRKDR